MHSPFWREVSETGNMYSHNLPIPHQQLLQHLDVLPQYTEQSPSLLFVYKPTFLVYEYYAFFIVISMLEKIGFAGFEFQVRKQIQEHFYVDGLQDGTTVVLHRDDIEYMSHLMI